MGHRFAAIGHWAALPWPAIACLLVTCGAYGQQRETLWSGKTPASHDALANCLAKGMWSEFASAPVVDPPPGRSAYVNLWPHRNAPVDPVATLYVRQERDGTTHILWQRLPTAPTGARWDAAARTTATRCATGNP